MASPIVTNKNINVHLNGKCQAIQKFNEVRVCVNGQYSKALKILKKRMELIFPCYMHVYICICHIYVQSFTKFRAEVL